EKGFCFFIFSQGLEKVFGHLHGAWGIVGFFPPPVSLCFFYFFPTGRLHTARQDEAFYIFSVFLRPEAAGPTGCKLLQPRLVIVLFGLSVYPPIAKSSIQGLGKGNRSNTCPLFEQLQPNAIGGCMMLSKPLLPHFRRFKSK